MSQFLEEAMRLEFSMPESTLKYLDEYLIEAKSIDVTEAKHLFKLTLLELQSIQNALADRVKDKYDSLAKKVKKIASKDGLAKAEEFKKAEEAKIQAWANKLRQVADTGAGTRMQKIKLAATRVGKKGKAGLAVAGAGLVAGGGYAAYRKAKAK